MYRKLADGCNFILRFMATIVAFINIQLALQDLQTGRVASYLPSLGQQQNLYLSCGFFVLLNLFLIGGIVWSSDFYVLSWLVVYSITIPVGSIMLGTNNKLPWAFGFSETAADYITPWLGLHQGFKPAVGLLHAFLNYITVSCCFLYKNMFIDIQDGSVLPMHSKQVKVQGKFLPVKVIGTGSNIRVVECHDSSRQANNGEKMQKFCEVPIASKPKCTGDF